MNGSMESRQREVLVIGHKNPDTDSICSAIAYAALKQKLTGDTYIPCRAGDVSRETAWVLQRFGLAEPELCEDVSPQLRDVDVRRTPGVSGEITVRQAWQLMKERDISTLPVVDERGWLLGIVSLRDLAVSHMEAPDHMALSRAGTPYRNIAQTLEGQILCGDADGVMTRGRVFVGAGNPEAITEMIHAHDTVIVSNRGTAQRAAIEGGADCVVVCLSAEIGEDIRALAEERGCMIISTPYDTYLAACFINQSTPLREHVVTEVQQFRLSTPLEDAVRIMGKTRHVYFPVLDDEGRYFGVISRRNLLSSGRRQLVLVDHNEKAQCVTGWETAEILEIVDHHRVGGLQTVGPIFFRNQPVGSTSTIIREMYRENGVAIDPAVAGAMCCAVLSDTLMLRSPTCTELDRQCVRELAGIAGVDPELLGEEMFEAGENLTGKTGEDILYQDFKIFTAGKVNFAIGQASFLSRSTRRQAEALVAPLLADCLRKNGVAMAYFLLTDIRIQSSCVLCAGEEAEEILRDTFHLPEEAALLLPGVVSRKKQFVPPLIAAVSRR